MDEFSLIETYFSRLTPADPSVILGIGDDAAVLAVPADRYLVVSTDTLVVGVHFLPQWPAAAIGHRALAVNLSDMAAMGAAPRWVSLALTLPELNEDWLSGFCKGFAELARRFQVSLIGGNIARGPLNITLTVHGLVAANKILRRDQAHVGDIIYVSGELGSAALALQQPSLLAALQRLLYPEPRVAHGQVLAGLASAGIDISDSLAADLGHILQHSGVGATIIASRLPVNHLLHEHCTPAQVWQLALTGGDDYELCFTVAPTQVAKLEQLLTAQQLMCYPIGVIESQQGLRCVTDEGHLVPIAQAGFQHF